MRRFAASVLPAAPVLAAVLGWRVPTGTPAAPPPSPAAARAPAASASAPAPRWTAVGRRPTATPPPAVVVSHADPTPAATSSPTVVAVASDGGAPAAGDAAVGCYGTGHDGPRVRALYLRSSDAPSRRASLLPAMRRWAAAVDAAVDASARASGGRRFVRWLTTTGKPGCALQVDEVVLPRSALASFAATRSALVSRGYRNPLTKYLLWTDASAYCGIADLALDSSPGRDNANNGGSAMYARVDRPCFGRTEGHEVLHTLGAVQTGAPNSTAGNHCNDGPDLLCYDDGSARATPQRDACPGARRPVVDCGNNDYFAVRPARGSYLASHWNVASSRFLASTLRDPAPKPTPAPASKPARKPTPPPKPQPSPSAQPGPSGPPAPEPTGQPTPNPSATSLPLLPPVRVPTLPPIGSLASLAGAVLGGG